MTKYNLNDPIDKYHYSIEQAYYKELEEWHYYEVALEQFARGELSEKPVKPFLVMV